MPLDPTSTFVSSLSSDEDDNGSSDKLSSSSSSSSLSSLSPFAPTSTTPRAYFLDKKRSSNSSNGTSHSSHATTMMTMTSALPGFFQRPVAERVEEVRKRARFGPDDLEAIATSRLPIEVANAMVENVIAVTSVPLGIATNFIINGKDVLIPMATEEPSVVAAASYGAKLARRSGGFVAKSSPPMMIGQVLLTKCDHPELARDLILSQQDYLVRYANQEYPSLFRRGGGVKRLEARLLSTTRGPMVLVHLHVDVCDSMGANAVTLLAERISPKLEELSGGVARMKILSNLCVDRVYTVEAVWRREDLATKAGDEELSGDDVIEAILDAAAFAEADEFRAATHNKGVMNGIDAVALATMNDTRAVESAAHCFASYGRPHYAPLTHYEKTKDGHLKGTIRVPLAVGIRGGTTQSHPMARVSLKILGAESADELGRAMAAVGLSQNFAAIRALVTEGICRGHLKLHAKQIALSAGATGDTVFRIANILAEEKNVTLTRAKELLHQIRRSDSMEYLNSISDLMLSSGKNTPELPF